MIETNRSTLHAIYTTDNSLPRRAAMTHTLSRRTATTRFSSESRLPETNGTNWAVTSQAFTRWRHQSEVELIWWIALLLIYRPRKDKRLSWPSWLACSGRFTHIVVTRRLQAERRTGSVRRPRTDVLPTVLHNQPVSVCAMSSQAPSIVRFRLGSVTIQKQYVPLTHSSFHRRIFPQQTRPLHVWLYLLKHIITIITSIIIIIIIIVVVIFY